VTGSYRDTSVCPMPEWPGKLVLPTLLRLYVGVAHQIACLQLVLVLFRVEGSTLMLVADEPLLLGVGVKAALVVEHIVIGHRGAQVGYVILEKQSSVGVSDLRQ